MSWGSWSLVIKRFVFLSILTEAARHSGWALLATLRSTLGVIKVVDGLDLRSQAFRDKPSGASG